MNTAIAYDKTENTLPPRWHVTAFYGDDILFYEIEELEELQEIIEDGPERRRHDRSAGPAKCGEA